MEKVDILMATYNGEKYIEKQIESIINQTFQNWTLFISDDGSNDATNQIIHNYSLIDERINIVPSKKCGSAKENFLYLLTFSSSKFVMFSDQDDEWLPNKIERAYNTMVKYDHSNTPFLLYSDLIVVDKELNIIDYSYFHYQSLKPNTRFKNLITQNCVTGCTMMFNDKLRAMALELKNPQNIIMHDWWMALIASAFGIIITYDEPLIKYRQHESNSIGAKKGYGIKYLYTKIRHISEIKASLLNTRIQCNEFYNTFLKNNKYKLNNPLIRNLSKEYGNINNNKFQRIYIYMKYKLHKNNVLKTLGFYLLG